HYCHFLRRSSCRLRGGEPPPNRTADAERKASRALGDPMAKYFIAVGGSGQHVALALVDQIVLAHHVYGATSPGAVSPGRAGGLEPFEFLVLDRDTTGGA